MSDGSKAIGSLAKKQSEVTRQGTQKLKFVPTLPVRRKKEEAKNESSASLSHAPGNAPVPNDGGGSRRGSGRRRGTVRQMAEMTASGPFSMGPALPGSGSPHSRSRLNFAPTAALSDSGLASRIASGSATANKKEVDLISQGHEGDEDEEIYSEPDDGVEIIDLQKVRELDWMAPETLRKERRKKRVKKEEKNKEVGVANAMDPSESEEEFDEIVEKFTQTNLHQVLSNEHGFFIFQFPSPPPAFLPNPGPDLPGAADPSSCLLTKDTALPQNIESTNLSTHPTISPELSSGVQTYDMVDGVIGQLEVYRSGAVKFRLNNGMLLDVNAAIQPSFFQQVVYLHRGDRRMVIIGDVSKKFVVSPNVDTLLRMMREADSTSVHLLDEEMLIQMDVS